MVVFGAWAGEFYLDIARNRESDLFPMRKWLMHSWPRLCVPTHLRGSFVLLLAVLISGYAWAAPGDDTNTASDSRAQAPQDTNAQALLEAVLQLKGEVRSNAVAVEQNNQALNEAVLQNAQAVSNGLRAIEGAFSAQRDDFSARSARELEAIQSYNRSLLLVAGSMAALALLTMILTEYFQWRTSRVWTEISQAFRSSPAALNSPALSGLGLGRAALVDSSPAGEINLRFLETIDRLEKRIQALEHGSKAPLGLEQQSAESRSEVGSSPALS